MVLYICSQETVATKIKKRRDKKEGIYMYKKSLLDWSDEALEFKGWSFEEVLECGRFATKILKGGFIMIINKNNLFCDTDAVAVVENGKLVRYWNGYSATTIKHINQVLEELNLPKITKKDWEELPCD